MCICQLTNKDNIDFSVAKEDLTFYKVLNKLDDGSYITPFRGEKVKLNVKYKETPKTFYTNIVHIVKPDSVVDIDKFFIYNGIKVVPAVNGGAIHLFTTKEEAERFIYYEDSDVKLVVVKAIVPKGTAYIEGVFPYNEKEAFSSVAVKQVTYRSLEYEGWFKELLKKLKLRN